MGRFAIAIAVVINLLSLGNVHSNETEDFFELSLEELLNVKITSATLTDHSLESIPAAVTVLSQSEIAKIGVDYLHELLAFIPGYQMVRSMDYSYQYSASSRGLKRGSSGREILYLINGHPVNGPRNGDSGGAFMYPVKLIQKLEVIRGPGASIYGTNAVTGVVNIITKKEEQNLTASLGSNQSQRLSASHLFNKDRLTLQTSIFVEKTDGDSYSLPDTFSNAEISVKDPFEQQQLDFNFTYNKTSVFAEFKHLSSNGFYNTGRLSEVHNYSDRKTTLVAVSHLFNWFETTESTFSASYFSKYSENGNQSTPQGAFSAISQPSSNEPFYGFGVFDSHRILVSLVNNKTIDNDKSFQYGFELRRNSLDTARGYTNYDLIDVATGNTPFRYYGNLNSSYPISDESALDSASAFGQYQTNIFDNWNATLGIRFDNYAEFTSRASPRLALVNKATPTHTWKVLYGEAFRVPDFSETSFRNTIAILGNPNLKHEVVKTWNVIWLGNFANTVWQIGIFSNELHNPIAVVVEQGKRTYKNVEVENSSGIEFEGHYQVNENWQLKIAGNHLLEIPEQAFRESNSSVSLQANFSLQELNINLAAYYNSERQQLNTKNELITLSDYWQMYGKISYRLTEQWQISATIKNLLDQKIEYPSSGVSLDNGIPEHALNWWAKLEYSF